MTNPPRLRQLVIAARSLETADQLAQVLSLGTPYIDPGVGEFGLVNRVYALGDQFLEVVVPVAETAPAARFIARGGEGGYMAIFQTDDIAATRARADAAGIRRVWNIDLPDISASHLHPADVGAAIVSIDEARPAESWRWGGPDWQKNAVPGRLTGAVLTSNDPARLAARWAQGLGVEANGGLVKIADADLMIHPGPVDRLARFRLAIPDAAEAAARAIRLGLEVVDNELRLAGVGLVLEQA
ncbi:VOC family protein [Hyphomonas sp.]|uniref:VOC family protein n=1 Tax=Hyphomonas sp. TaxID=87 RepID=UPI00391A54C3